MIYFFDISIAFLHSPLNSGEPIYVWPPVGFYPLGNILWELKKAMYGLISAPTDWQSHWATVIAGIGVIRLQSDANAYMHTELQVYTVADDGDLMIIGTMWAINKILPLLNEKYIIKPTGELKSEGSAIAFLGIILTMI